MEGGLAKRRGLATRRGLKACLVELQTPEIDSVWGKVAPIDDKELEREVTDLIVAYLTRSPAAQATVPEPESMHPESKTFKPA